MDYKAGDRVKVTCSKDELRSALERFSCPSSCLELFFRNGGIIQEEHLAGTLTLCKLYAKGDPYHFLIMLPNDDLEPWSDFHEGDRVKITCSKEDLTEAIVNAGTLPTDNMILSLQQHGGVFCSKLRNGDCAIETKDGHVIIMHPGHVDQWTPGFMLRSEHESVYTKWLLSSWFGSDSFAGLAKELATILLKPTEVFDIQTLERSYDTVGFFQYQSEIYPVPMSYVIEA